jgi:adenine phosphoribosyltransferase
MPEAIRSAIRVIPDFPKEGIQFYDLSTLLLQPDLVKQTTELLALYVAEWNADYIAAIDARGFWFGAPVAQNLGLPWVPVRKPGKLPGSVRSQEYELEYGTDTLCIHDDVIPAGARVAIIDDLLATGGTAMATANLIEQLGATVVGFACVVDLANLDFLPNRKNLTQYPIASVLEAEG